MVTEVTTDRSVVADYMLVIESADLADLRTIPNDRNCKKGKTGIVRSGDVSIQGMILDSCDDRKLSGVQAMRLLVMCHRRLNENVEGLSKVIESGELVPIFYKHKF